MRRRLWMVWLAASALTAASSRAGATSAPTPDPPTAPTLIELVETFFRMDDESLRASLIGQIETAADGSVEAVARSVGRAKLWAPLSDPRGMISVETPAGALDVAYRLPPAYDPADRHPMIVCMPRNDASPQTTLARASWVLGKAADGFVLICPDRPIGGSFHQPTRADTDLPTFLRQVWRRIHTDTDRVFLFGIDAGGDAAWIAAIMHADLFAGAIVLSGYPRVPYAEQVYPFLLANLGKRPVLTVWTAIDPSDATTRRVAVALHNRAVATIARRAHLPVTDIEVPGEAASTLRPPEAQVAAILGGRRSRPARQVLHWFRYPDQGHVGWLRQTTFKGDAWRAGQLSILASPSTDRDRYTAKIIRGKLAFLGGRVEGQTITIETQRCARIDLLFPEDLVDLDRPITVRCNGTTRHRGLVRRSIRTLLTTAYENWEFQRLVVARLTFSIKRDGQPP